MTTMLREREIGKIAVVQGWLVYLILFRRFPMTALKEVAGAVLLFLAGIAACFVLGVM